MDVLREHEGSWEGTNRFRLRPDDEPGEGPATARLAIEAGGVVVLAYAWTHPQDGPQEGTLTLGLGDEPGSALGLWGDSWHQKPAVAPLRGTVDDESVTVGYEYAEGWWWWITITPASSDLLRWQMDNVVPPSASGAAEPIRYWAMQAELRRS